MNEKFEDELATDDDENELSDIPRPQRRNSKTNFKDKAKAWKSKKYEISLTSIL